jgi:STE24 endopeptidase
MTRGRLAAVTEPERSALARRPAVVTLVVSLSAVVVLALWLVPWSWVPGGHLVPMKPSDLFSAEQVSRAERYSWWRRGLGWPSYFLSLALPLVLAFSARGAALLRRVTSHRRWWVGVPVGVLAVVLAERLLVLPLQVALHQVDLEFGISRQGWPAWSLDQLRSVLVTWVATALVLLILVGIARRSPRWWFAWAGAVAMLLTFAGSFLYPVLVEPVFNRFTPMAAGPLRESLLRLAASEGVPVDEVLVADASRRTTTLNAYVSGLAGTRRIVVYDNLVDELPADQVRVIVAHELGHAKHQDVLLGTALGAVGSVGAVALLALLLDDPRVRRSSRTSGPGDPAVVGLVLALAAVGAFLVSPAQNTVSRAIETRADRASLEATHADATFVRMQRQLALTSLADPTPPALTQFWWGSHPTVLQRAGLPGSLRAAQR